ncbi:MAG: LruC domain-containing protein [Planctomycetota bacterium]
MVFAVSADANSAIEGTEAFVYSPGDADGDGVFGINDHFPSDPNRAFVLRVPAVGYRIVGAEDRYPWLGDADYNDVLIAYAAERITDASGDVVELGMTSHLVARGATYEHKVGIHIPGIPDDASGNVRIQRFTSGSSIASHPVDAFSIQSLIDDRSKRMELFPSTVGALPPPPWSLLTNANSGGINMPAASSRYTLEFDTAVPLSLLGTAPYDLFVSVKHDDEYWDIHYPGFPAFPERPGYLPDESDSSSFLDDEGYPWILEIPMEWRFPLETNPVWECYPSINGWVSSAGQGAQSWYDNLPGGKEHLVSEPVADYLPTLSWSIDLTSPSGG